MGWNIKIKKTKAETKYKIWSTVSDSYITDKWMSRQEIVQFLFWHRLGDFVEKFLEDAMTFPNGYAEKGGNRIHLPEISEEYYDFKMKSLKSKNRNMLYEKFFDEINKLNIKFSIKDDKYDVEN